MAGRKESVPETGTDLGSRTEGSGTFSKPTFCECGSVASRQAVPRAARPAGGDHRQLGFAQLSFSLIRADMPLRWRR